MVILSIPELILYEPEKFEPPPPDAERFPGEYPDPELSIDNDVTVSSNVKVSQYIIVSVTSSPCRS